jgi:NAD(P)-dependent dehydrogenase (short-subunit alcohol dehydrogenase family)
MPERLAGKTAFITGATSGIGEATARLFAAEGARVALVARGREGLERVAGELGDAALPLVADVVDSGAIEAAAAAAAAELGGLDAVVANAGTITPGTLAETDDESWNRQIDVNLTGAFYTARAAAPRIKEGGSIVMLGSELSAMGMGMYAPYCASKFGVIGLMKALAAELAPAIRVNAICPGPIDTPLLAGELEYFGDNEKVMQETYDRVPLGRLGTSEEVAAGILYLAADAPYATGTTLELDGGTTAV